jgi:hypothetical protein
VSGTLDKVEKRYKAMSEAWLEAQMKKVEKMEEEEESEF